MGLGWFDLFFLSLFLFFNRWLGKKFFSVGKVFAFGCSVLVLPHVSVLAA